jgi:hypothetical protein
VLYEAGNFKEEEKWTMKGQVTVETNSMELSPS